jgi:hypothetical protein
LKNDGSFDGTFSKLNEKTDRFRWKNGFDAIPYRGIELRKNQFLPQPSPRLITAGEKSESFTDIPGLLLL